jgi:PPK2 family polyphosphate:nucleotide phosphotransferase
LLPANHTFGQSFNAMLMVHLFQAHRNPESVEAWVEEEPRMKLEKLIKRYRVKPGKKVNLRKDFDPGDTAGYQRETATELLEKGVQWLAEQQDKLYAENTRSLLIILQAMDAAGKDGTIKHVMSGLNPQGCQVYSFKAPSSEELDHDYLWRSFKALPARGHIGIFNRSYYEEVLIARVHPEILARQQLPPELKDGDVWQRRFDHINAFEKYLVENGIYPVKIFLNVSHEEQRKRFLERIDRPEKNWKLSARDAEERQYWGKYMDAFEDVFTHTSTEWAPWHVLPADNKWFTRIAAAALIAHKLLELKPQYPTVSEAQQQELQRVKAMLLNEDGAKGKAEKDKDKRKDKKDKK